MSARESDRAVVRVAFGISGAVFAALIWLLYMRTAPENVPAWTASLPGVNAALNAATLTLVSLGVLAIRSGRRNVHIGLLAAALAVGTAFLLSYVTYHVFQGDTPYAGTGLLRPVYFTVLITHIVASALALPLVLTAALLAARRRFAAHRRWARVAAPIWVYVSLSGLVVYAMLYG